MVHAQTPTDITSQLTFTTIDVPGAGATFVFGMNSAGDMVGLYGKTNYNDRYRGFLLRAGQFTSFFYPGALSTWGTGINDSGLILGYASGYAREVSFVYDGTTFTPIKYGSNSATVAWDINNSGDIVGGAGTLGSTIGFELRNGHFKDIAPPGNFTYIYATGINNLGQVVGWTDYDGFAYQSGKFQTITFPGASQTEAWGINDESVMVGWYAMAPYVNSFVLANGNYNFFSYPGAKQTIAYGITTSGQVVGGYSLDNITFHGFVTSPITPESLKSPRLRSGSVRRDK